MKKTKQFYKRETFKSRELWLSNRGIGGSSASCILSLNPWKTKLSLYIDILNSINRNRNELNVVKEEDNDNEVLAYGRALEPLIRREFALDHKDKYKVYAPVSNAMYRSTIRPWQTATIDSKLVEIETGRKGVHEIKTHDIRRREDAEQWETGTIPNNYFVQILHYLSVLNDYEFAILTARLRYWKFDGDKFVIDKIVTLNYFIERKEVQNQIDFLVKKEEEFFKSINDRRLPAIMVKLPSFKEF